MFDGLASACGWARDRHDDDVGPLVDGAHPRECRGWVRRDRPRPGRRAPGGGGGAHVVQPAPFCPLVRYVDRSTLRVPDVLTAITAAEIAWWCDGKQVVASLVRIGAVSLALYSPGVPPEERSSSGITDPDGIVTFVLHTRSALSAYLLA